MPPTSTNGSKGKAKAKDTFLQLLLRSLLRAVEDHESVVDMCSDVVELNGPERIAESIRNETDMNLLKVSLARSAR